MGHSMLSKIRLQYYKCTYFNCFTSTFQQEKHRHKKPIPIKIQVNKKQQSYPKQ